MPGAAAAAQAADQQKKAAGAPQKASGAAQKAPAVGKADTAGQGASRRGRVVIYREAFAYTMGAERDPFMSLMLSGELRPILTDLVLTGVIYDPEGRRSVALLVDGSTGESYRIRVGQTLARMKVTKIGLQDITFSIDEFGLSRSETLIIDKTRKGPVAAQRRP